MTKSSNEVEVEVWAWTPDFDLITVDDQFDESSTMYGLQNRHTQVVEIKESIFSNAINLLVQIQDNYDAIADLIGEDGGIIDGEQKPKEGMH